MPYVRVVLMLSEWVDFHWEVDGKTYDFSLPGGGFVSFTDLVEVLGINDETGAAAKKFVDDVASLEFSSPELVWVGKTEAETTVGALKEANGLECEYSAELTEEQIKEISETEVESGDWALISVQPFESEESLTVTMKNGEVFTVKVTDAQIKKTVIDAKGDTWEIIVTYGEDAQIPEGAQLYVSEITEPELYDEYMQRAAEAVEQETGDNNPLYGRFFDIQIKHGDDIIEPKAAVDVTIKYVESVSLGKEDSMSAIHFAENGIDLIEVNPEKNDEGGAEISFEQGSFSITGTIITSGVISNGNYCILYKNGNNYYALANDGSAVQVSVDENGAVKPVNGEDLPTNLIWTRSGQVWRGNQNTGRYLYPDNSSATSTSSANLTITSSDDSDGNEIYKIYRNGRNPYYLRFNNNSFTGGTSNSSNQFYLARIESNTNVKIHYGYLDDSGNYVEWTDRQETLRNPNMLGDQ